MKPQPPCECDEDTLNAVGCMCQRLRSRAHDTDRVCYCVVNHNPAPLELEAHHVWPLGMGGPDILSNIAWVCPTTHTNTHELLRWMVRDQRLWTWQEALDAYEQPVSRYAFQLACTGFRSWQAKAVIRRPIEPDDAGFHPY